ncbi:MAG: hypothetical protein JNJ85_05050 [Candidatus Kapabacteria bacterium]|nr:hypothetical protein [Candidatus Kapabacteria bacterium]MBX7153545.1 hypothetical protein [Bacteroidota bacterium]
MKFIQILCFTLLTTYAYGQTLSNEVDSIYNFKPSKITENEKRRIGTVLDKFWEKVKNDTTRFLQQLRAELQTNKHKPFFYYDGSSLLLSLTNSIADKELAIEAIAKCDVDDISREIYVKTLNRLANEGFNVTKPSIKILYEDNFSFFIPQHAMTFNQGYCLTYLLLPQKNVNYVDTLIKIFASVKPEAQESIITTLWFDCTCKGDQFLNSIYADTKIDKSVREYAKKIMGYKLREHQQEYVNAMSKDQLDSLRKEVLTLFSDEAIGLLDLTTRARRKENKCP